MEIHSALLVVDNDVFGNDIGFAISRPATVFELRLPELRSGR
jgi:hypothetical protein